MKRKNIKSSVKAPIVFLPLYFFTLLPLNAQTTPENQSLWLGSSNAAGYVSFDDGGAKNHSLSKAQLSYNGSWGGLRGVNGSHHENSVEAGASSWYLFPKSHVVLTGGMSYRYQVRDSVGGSVWFRPDQAPFNITETDDKTKGEKTADIYHIWGAVATPIGYAHRLSAGIIADYTTTNIAKRKDPRQKDSFLDFVISPGIRWDVNGVLSIGANYIYQRQIESMTYKLVGRQDKVYTYLIDYGAYYGNTETTDGSGYTDRTAERPLVDERHGGSLQLAFKRANKEWLNELTYLHRHGHYGEESPSLISYSRHRGDILNFDSRLRIHTKNARQTFGVHTDYDKVMNFERSYRSETSVSGVQNVSYYGEHETGHRKHGRVSVDYIGYFIQHGDNTKESYNREIGEVGSSFLKVSTLAGWDYMRLTASIYPYYRQQKTNAYYIDADATFNKVAGRTTWLSYGLGLGLRSGNGTKAHDGDYSEIYGEAAEPDFDQKKPYSQTDYLNRDYEFCTATTSSLRAHFGVGFRPVKSSANMLIMNIDYQWNHAYDIEYISGSNRHNIEVTLGYLF